MALPFWLKRACVRTGIARVLPMTKRLTNGEPHFAKYVSDRVLAAPIDELLDPATFPPSPGHDVIDLNLESPVFDAAPTLRPGHDRDSTDPFGLAELRDAIAANYRRDGRIVDPAHQILVTHGATGAFASVLDAFVNPGDRVVLFDPCSPLLHLGAKSRRATLRWIPTWNEDGRTRFLNAGLMRSLRGAKLLVLALPASPTGGRFTADDLEEIAWHANRHDVLVCVDESLSRFQYEGKWPRLEAFPGTESRMLTIDSTTAGYASGALSVGWLSGHRQLVRTAALCANLNAPVVPSICQHSAIGTLRKDRAAFEPMLKSLRDRRQYAFDRLKGMGLEPTWPAAGVTLWVSVASLGIDGRTLAEKLLREERVLVGPGCAYGPSGTNFVRVSFAPEEGRLREGLTRLGHFVERIRTGVSPETKIVTARVTTSEAVAIEPSFSRV